MGKPSASQPATPNVGQEVQGQEQANLQSATLNNANQVTPYGSLNYQYNPATGQFTATQSLTPQQQVTEAATQNAQQTVGNALLNQLTTNQGSYATGIQTPNSPFAAYSTALNTVNTPMDTNYDDVRNQYIQSQMSLLQPQLDQQQQTLQSQLANQGVAQGSNAYNNAQRTFTQSQNQAYADILANAQTGVNQAIQGQTALRQEPIQEAGAAASLLGTGINQSAQLQQLPLQEAQTLLSGGYVQQPTYAGTSQTAAPNVLGAYGQQQQIEEANYQSALQQQQGLFGDIGGLAGTVLGAPSTSLIGSWLSDERLKTDIKQVGSLMQPGGKEIPLKTFRYYGDPVRRLGFVAQDAEDANPDAVWQHSSGYKGVRYAKVLMDAHRAAQAKGAAA